MWNRLMYMWNVPNDFVYGILANLLGPPLTWYEIFRSTCTIFGFFAMIGLFLYFVVNGPSPIKMLLNCDRATAKEIMYIMRKQGISYDELHANSCAAMGYFLPLYGRVVDDRPIAWSGETKQAIVFALMRGRIRRRMGKEAFIQTIAEELKHFRDDNSPLTDTTRQVDGIMF